MKPRYLSVVTLVSLLIQSAGAQSFQTVPLWPEGAPGFENRRNEPEQAKD